MSAARLARTALALALGALIAASGTSADLRETTASQFPVRGYIPQIASDGNAPRPSGASSFTVHFLDVGQGDATLITVSGQRLLIDGGRTANLALQRLQALGVKDLDAIVATHPDADHVGGLAAVLAAFNVERIYVNGDPSETQVYSSFLAAAHAEGGQVITATRGMPIPLGGLQLPVLNPATLSGDTNDDSIVLRLTCGSVSVQFEGDAEIGAEQSMLAAGLVTDVDVLKVGHHGSNTASSLSFLQSTKAEVAVISAGLNNQFGHPHAEVVSRLLSLGTALVYTDTGPGNDSRVLSSNCSTYSFSDPGSGSTPSSTPTLSPSPPAPPTAATATPTPPGGGACGGATATITGLDKVGEVVWVSASGDLSGWRIVSLTGHQTFNFPLGFVANGAVQVRSATPQFGNSAETLWWTTANVWNNSSDDDAALYDCNGKLVQTFDDGR